MIVTRKWEGDVFLPFGKISTIWGPPGIPQMMSPLWWDSSMLNASAGVTFTGLGGVWTLWTKSAVMFPISVWWMSSVCSSFLLCSCPSCSCLHSAEVFLQICSNLNGKCSCPRITDFPNWVCGIWEDSSPPSAPNSLCFCFSITTVGPARKIDSQECVFPSISVGMQSLNVSWAPSFSGHVLWVGMFSGCWTNYCSKYKGASAEGRKTTVFFSGGDMETGNHRAPVKPL